VALLLALIALVFGVPVLWAVSVGALRDARRARQRDPREGCQAWVAVPRMGRRRYRCGAPLHAGGPTCRRHALADLGSPAAPAASEDGVVLVDEPQDVGRALAQARVGVPLAIASTLGALALLLWLVL
jgi:hypothetical protein